MLVQRLLLALMSVEVLAVCARRYGVVVPEEAALAQLGQQQLNDVLEGLGKENIGLASLQTISHLFRRADEHRPIATDAHMLSNRVLGPLGRAGRESRIPFHRRPHGVALDLAQLLLVAVLPEIDARPPAKQRQRALERRVLPVVGELGLRLLLRAPEDGRHEREHLDVLAVAPVARLGEGANLGHVLGAHGGR
ncbi:hypothetical protein BN1708_011677, partial [Verticillium longisporum]